MTDKTVSVPEKGNWEQSVMGWFIYMIEERPVSLIGLWLLLVILVAEILIHFGDKLF